MRTYFLFGLLVLGCLDSTRGLSFDALHIDRELAEAYYTMPMDVSEDGNLDIVAVTTSGEVVWYENPSWKKHAIVFAEKTVFIDKLEDIDGDGHDELVICHNFGNCPDACTADTGDVSYLSRPAAGLIGHGNWTLTNIGRAPATHRVRAFDVDGDGREEVIAAPVVGVGADPKVQYRNSAVTVVLWRRNSGGLRGENILWKEEKVVEGLHAVHQMRGSEWAGKRCLLIACLEGIIMMHYNVATSTWEKTILHEGDQEEAFEGASEVATGTVNGKPYIATQEPFHGDKAAIYTPVDGDATRLKRKQIALVAQGAHALDTADVNSDGDTDIVAGWRGPERKGVYIYLAPDFKEVHVHSAEGVSGIAIADYNKDGLLDVAFASWGGGNVLEPYVTLLSQTSDEQII